MCKIPIRVFNRSKVLYKNLLQPFVIDVPCGHCEDCLTSKRLSWRYRIYWQMYDAICNKHGFVLFDTLTYNDDNLPYFSRVASSFGYDFFFDNDFPDFSTFCYRDVTLYLKRFRKSFHKLYPDASLKYFYCSEYGQDDNFTHRPHYHILFFITGVEPNNSSYMSINRLSHNAWSLGRTDYYGNDGVLFFHWSSRCVVDSWSSVTAQRISAYLSKYVTKSLDFDKVSYHHFGVLRSYLDNNFSPSEAGKLFNSFKRYVSPCFRSSHDFGVCQIDSYLKSDNKNSDDFVLSIPDSKQVVIRVPLTVFFKRRLYYCVHKSDDGTRSWRLTELGLKRLWTSLSSRFVKMCQQLHSCLAADASLSSQVAKLLGSRSLEDFVFYKVCYQGRIKDFSRAAEFNKLSPVEFVNQLDYLRSTFPLPVSYFSTYCDNGDFVVLDESSGDYIPMGRFCSVYLYNSQYIPEWHDFDLIDNLFVRRNAYLGVNNTNAYYVIEDLGSRLKSLV